MSYSKLTNKAVPITAKCNERGCGITKITPHYMAGNMSAENCAKYHRDSAAQASANYYIGSDGTIVSGVPEEYRAWTSASWDNDRTAITFECANVDANGTLTNACYNSLVKLCADICNRYGISPHYNGAPSGSITMHKQFVPTSCPGNWLTNKIVSGQLEKDIRAVMGGGTVAKPSTPSPKPSGKKWVQDTIIDVGDTVKSVSCAIAVIPGTGSAIRGNLVNVPALGGLVPLADVDEAADTKDGKCDNYLANTNSRVFYLPKKVIAIDVANNLCKCAGCDYWIKCGPLMAQR